MEKQPTIRPWSRLASLARLEAAQGQTTAPVSAPPAAAPPPPRPPVQAPVPRIPLARALTTNTQAPPTLQQETLPLPPPPQQQPSQQQQETPSRSMGNGAPPVSRQSTRLQASSSPSPLLPRIRIPSRDPTPPESPRVIRSSSSTPAESPRTRTFRPFPAQPSPNPEPERKPSPNPEPEPKPAIQERSTSSVKAVAEINKESGDNGGATPLFPRNKPAATETSATSRKDDGGTWKAITIAGDNMGAYMELGSSQHHQKQQKEKHQNGHQQHHQGLEIESGSEAGRTADKKGGKNVRKPIAAVVNSNVQSVNNSLLFSSKCSQNSPGVHLGLASHHQPKPSTDPSFVKRNQ
ncbi:putative basic proline-rich protein-like [Iris pallida]|uniref:Basic proline-rich protein-like n=1 Tax=Iris pallida TaxID=29817 RepID=A0AAX6EAJ4_IRIPA|nr:putative basic proline-rich protein-like [Iris pallida]